MMRVGDLTVWRHCRLETSQLFSDRNFLQVELHGTEMNYFAKRYLINTSFLSGVIH